MKGKKKLVSRLAGVLAVLLVAVLVIGLLIPGGDGLPALGIGFYAVLSQSMSPTIEAGSLIMVRRATPGDIEIGDVITFRMQEGSETLVTHRVAGIRTDGPEILFTTRGDANNVEDPSPVAAGQLLGKTVLWIGGLGFLTANFRALMIAALVGLIVLWIAYNVFFRRKDDSSPLNKEPG